MRLITRQILASEAVYVVREPVYYPTVEELETYQKVKALGSTPHPDAVEGLCGEGSTLLPVCSDCHARVDALVELGDDSRYERHPEAVWVCVHCLTKAVNLFDEY